jgi:hypothetical protein
MSGVARCAVQNGQCHLGERHHAQPGRMFMQEPFQGAARQSFEGKTLISVMVIEMGS